MCCPRGKSDNLDGSKFCIECGIPAKSGCPRCGADYHHRPSSVVHAAASSWQERRMPNVIRGSGQELPQRPHHLSRRTFLVSLSTLMMSRALGRPAFTELLNQQESSPAASTPEFRTAEATAVRPIESLSIDEFLKLSAVLTGVNSQELNPDLGRFYLESLRAPPNQDINLTDLYAQAGLRSSGPPQNLDALAKSGVLAQEHRRILANKIVEYWYTGTYETDTGPAVATFTDALAWKVLPWTKPPSFCGGAMGYWSEIPNMTF